jgi:hypothetical protein
MADGGGTKDQKLKVSISYSRRDSDAADTLVDALSERGFDVTIDSSRNGRPSWRNSSAPQTR